MMALTLYGFRFSALGGDNELQIYAPSLSQAQMLAAEAIKEVLRIQRKFSRYCPDSVLSRINSAAGTDRVLVDEETACLLQYADACFHESEGLFDCTSGVLRRAWDFKGKTLPSPRAIEQLLPLVGWEKVEWESPWIFLSRRGMELDIGGIGKEYAVDRVTALLLSLGVQHGLVNLGGDLRIVGRHPDGAPWLIGIRDPRDVNRIVHTAALTSGALATSGDYERAIISHGKRYCHILNPKSGWPINELQSVTVSHASCLVAGTLSTTSMLLPAVQAVHRLKSLNIQFLAVHRSGRVEHTLDESIKRNCDSNPRPPAAILDQNRENLQYA